MKTRPVPSGTIQQRLAELHEGVPAANIRELIDEMRSGRFDPRAPLPAIADPAFKGQQYAAAAVLIEAYWKVLEDEFRTVGGALVSGRVGGSGPLAACYRRHAGVANRDQCFAHAFRDFRQGLRAIFKPWFTRLEGAKDRKSEPETPQEKALHRLEALLKQREEAERAAGGVKMLSHPGANLASGLDTGLTAVWGALRGIPDLFKAKFGRQPTSEEMKAIALNSRPYFRSLASLFLPAFGELNSNANISTTRGKSQPVPIPGKLKLVQVDGGWGLALASAPRRPPNGVQGHPAHTRVRVGCPAMHARLEGSKDKTPIDALIARSVEVLNVQGYLDLPLR